jgi:hypothetical protein
MIKGYDSLFKAVLSQGSIHGYQPYYLSLMIPFNEFETYIFISTGFFDDPNI